MANPATWFFWVLLILAVGPGVIWMFWFYLKDRYEPEPRVVVARIFLLGAVALVPAAVAVQLAAYVLPLAFLPLALLPLVIGPLFEEFAKYGVVRAYIYNDPEFDEPMDGIIYAVAAALGFATLENIAYVEMAAFASVPIALGVCAMRAFLAVPGHALFSLCWGAALGRARFMNPGRGRVLVIVGFTLAVALHGLFNYLVMNTIAPVLLGVPLMVVMWIGAGWAIQSALRTNNLEQEVHT